MSTPVILHIAIPTPLRKTFDYLLPAEMVCCIGARVKVSFGRQQRVGVVVGVSETSSYPIEKLKPIDTVIDQVPLLDQKLLELYQWASDYYHHPIGEVIVGTLPKRVRIGEVSDGEDDHDHHDGSDALDASCERKFAEKNKRDVSCERKRAEITLTSSQQTAIEKIQTTKNFLPFLLAGVTGSGKTEVYLQAIADVLEKKQQALVLVPEISLTPQTVSRFKERFPVPVLLLHSGLTDKQRYLAWMQAARDQPCIVIGTRSAVFAPLKNCGIIIVDEEHDVSFKQQSGFRYSARDIAIMRAKLLDIPIVLGSATPAVETWKNAQENKYTLLTLPDRVGNAVLPEIIIHNICREKLTQGLSPALIEKMQLHLNPGNQVLLFLNRRGYAPLMLCHQCGYIEKCKRCDTRLILHNSPKQLRCHHCGFAKAIPKNCAQCQQAELLALGLGTEQLESALQKLFPSKNILRMDRDVITTFKKLTQALQKIQAHEADIIVGTQMLVKGHHFENVTLVAAIDVDQALFSNDFRAMERLGQSLIQVAGRAGRAEKRGEVFIQTHHADHPLLQTLLRQNYQHFSDAVLSERSQALLPPYSHMALLRAEGKSKEAVYRFLNHLKENISSQTTAHIAGPFPLTIEKLAGVYRAQLLMHSNHRVVLKNTVAVFLNMIAEVKQSKAIKWMVDVDPVEV